ncbi:MAG: GNAT family N-acetyltransferase, partial [Clostridiales bacterium]|nr:GNAT family N-acetyltransferase [Clostridiales bacterium]
IIKETEKENHGSWQHHRIVAFTDDGSEEMSCATMNIIPSRFSGGYINVMTWGGIGTAPQYRRQGCVKSFFEKNLSRAREFDAASSLLHPFSFSYYRQFGYERVSDTVQVRCPMSALSFLPRYPDLIPFTPDKSEEALSLFERFSKNRNLMFKRFNTDFLTRGNRNTWLYYRRGELCGYVTLEVLNHFDGINRMISDDLAVYELCFIDRDSLLHLMSFLRMYEGQLETVKFHDIGPVPEVDLILRHYMHTDYSVHPDVMARVIDSEKMLLAASYPDEYGVFTVNIEDSLKDVAGTFRVCYQNGKCDIERLNNPLKADLTLTAQPFVKILYGTDDFNAELASYMDGVKLNNDAKDFFRAFPKRINGIFEHF